MSESVAPPTGAITIPALLTEHEDATPNNPCRVEICGICQPVQLGFQRLKTVLELLQCRHGSVVVESVSGVFACVGGGVRFPR